MKVVVYGPPCAGKTTVARAISTQAPNLRRLSCRGMCQDEVARNIDDGRIWESCDRSRLPFPSGLANRIAAKYLRGIEAFVIDGYPKSLDEVEFFVELTGGPTHLFIVAASLDEVQARAERRLECTECITSFDRSQVRCPECSRPGTRRREDDPDVVESRFRHYVERSRFALPALRGVSGEVHEGSSEELVLKSRSVFRLAS